MYVLNLGFVQHPQHPQSIFWDQKSVSGDLAIGVRTWKVHLNAMLLNTADVMCGTRRNLTLVQLFTILEEKKRRGLGWHELHLVSSPFQLFLLPICYSKSDLSYRFFCNSATTLKVSHDFPKLAIIPSCTRINNHWFQTVLGALGVLKRTKLRALLPCVNFKVDVSLKGTLVGD